MTCTKVRVRAIPCFRRTLLASQQARHTASICPPVAHATSRPIGRCTPFRPHAPPARAGRPCRLHVSFAVEISTTNEAARHGAASRAPR
ncbi:hypothetical protein C6P88_19290 [Burkholderia contaminans]|nr:hypothetical protein C6P88_19290 [Burkholderia contaminans]